MSDLPLVLRRVAQTEFYAAVEWYDEHWAGGSEKFSDSIRELLSLIKSRPKLHPKVHGNIREALSLDFPYAVYYRLDTEQITVLAIVHTSRNPAEWQNRI